MTRIRCLCCGSLYESTRDCPNVRDGRHSLERAVRVSRALLLRGIDRPTADDIRKVK